LISYGTDKSYILLAEDISESSDENERQMVSDDERHSASIWDDPTSDAADSEFRDKHQSGEIVNSDCDEIIQSSSDENINSSSEDTHADVKLSHQDAQDTNANGAHHQMDNEENSDITVRHVVDIKPDKWNAIKPTYKGGTQVLNSK